MLSKFVIPMVGRTCGVPQILEFWLHISCVVGAGKSRLGSLCYDRVFHLIQKPLSSISRRNWMSQAIPSFPQSCVLEARLTRFNPDRLADFGLVLSNQTCFELSPAQLSWNLKRSEASKGNQFETAFEASFVCARCKLTFGVEDMSAIKNVCNKDAASQNQCLRRDSHPSGTCRYIQLDVG